MKELMAVIDRLEENKAVLQFSDGQTLTLSVEHLPAGAKEGAILSLFFSQDQIAEKDRIDKAKALLNEILRKKS